MSTAGPSHDARIPRRPRAGQAAGRALQIGLPLIALAILGCAVGTTAAGEALERLAMVDLAAAVLLGLVAALASAGRWCAVARGLGIELGLRRAVDQVYRSTLLNAVLPAGVLGDVERGLRQGATDGRSGVAAVALERGAGQAVIAAAALALAAPAVFTTANLHLPTVLLPVGVAAGAVAIGAALAMSRRRPELLVALAKAVAALRGVVLVPRTAIAIVGCSLVALASYLGLFLLAARRVGVDAPVAELVPVLAVCLLATAIPLNVGGWGPREVGSTAAFAAAGIGPAEGLAVAVLYGLLSLAAALPGAVLLLLPRRTRRRCGTAPNEPIDDLEQLMTGPGHAAPTAPARAAG